MRSFPPWLFEKHDLANPVADERIDQVANHGLQRRGIDVHRQRERHLIRLGPVRDRRQQDDLRAALVRLRTDLLADRIGLKAIGAVRQMKIVRLRRPQRQHRHFERMHLDVGVIGFGKFPRTGHWCVARGACVVRDSRAGPRHATCPHSHFRPARSFMYSRYCWSSLS